MPEIGLEVRAGLHTGECELIDGKVAGIAVHTGARVAANASTRRSARLQHSQRPRRRLRHRVPRPRPARTQGHPRRMAPLRGPPRPTHSHSRNVRTPSLPLSQSCARGARASGDIPERWPRPTADAAAWRNAGGTHISLVTMGLGRLTNREPHRLPRLGRRRAQPELTKPRRRERKTDLRVRRVTFLSTGGV